MPAGNTATNVWIYILYHPEWMWARHHYHRSSSKVTFSVGWAWTGSSICRMSFKRTNERTNLMGRIPAIWKLPMRFIFETLPSFLNSQDPRQVFIEGFSGWSTTTPPVRLWLIRGGGTLFKDVVSGFIRRLRLLDHKHYLFSSYPRCLPYGRSGNLACTSFNGVTSKSRSTRVVSYGKKAKVLTSLRKKCGMSPDELVYVHLEWSLAIH